jgi:hypothetical protein
LPVQSQIEVGLVDLLHYLYLMVVVYFIWVFINKKEGIQRMRAIIFTGVSLLLLLIVIGGFVSSQGV